ncbi:IclR family transcriptional regulator [Blastococcus sp. URHD0036]|uniref:IclR family transcriptional regulator n=1 Tax=Blastococcus sp. URHD0036 TaxID=1380356 RepID=UPI00068AA9FC|nr:IclR family transcriptional regulator [Blastococcus sp. URHD0036]
MADEGNRSAVTALTVLEELSLSDGVGVSALARQLGLPKSTVQRTLATLEAAGWVRRDADARWGLTLRCAVVGQRVMERTTLTEVVRPLVLELRDATQETVRCFLVESLDVVLLDLAESGHAVRAVEQDQLGSTPLHATAIGRAVLAARPDALPALLAGPLPAVTPRTLTDPELLRRDVELVRERGWAEVREETHLDVGGVAAVAGLPGGVLVGMGVTYPLHRASGTTAQSTGRLVREFTDRAAQLIGPRVVRRAR